MDYKCFKKHKLLIVLLCIVFFSCSQNEEKKASKIYYIEFINFKDSLKQYLAKDIFGKVSYYKNNQLQILSLNYVTDDYPDMHYFKDFSDIGNKVNPGSEKISIEMVGNYSVDSINYSLQKYKFQGKEWKKISDMGVIKQLTTYKKTKIFDIKEFVYPTVKNLIEYSY